MITASVTFQNTHSLLASIADPRLAKVSDAAPARRVCRFLDLNCFYYAIVLISMINAIA